MKALVSLSILALLSCGDSETRSVPSYQGKIGVKPDIYLSVPYGVPNALALAYKDYQALLTEEEWELFLTSVKGFCDGDITAASLNSRLKLWFPELPDKYARMPQYSRTESDRKIAWIFWKSVRGNVKVEDLQVKPAPDNILSKANKDEFQAPMEWYDKHLRDKIYDCVEGYPKRNN